MFLKQDVPACGFSLGLERIIVVMSERGMFPTHIATTSADVLIAGLGLAFLAEAVGLAVELRKVGIRVSVYPDAASKPQKSLSYADALEVPLAILIGEDEHNKGIVTVRNLVERTQERPVRQIAVEVVEAMLSSAKRTRELDQKKLAELREYESYLSEDKENGT